MTWVIWNESFKNSFIESYCFLPKLIKHSLDWWKYANKMLTEIFPWKNSIALSRKLYCNDFCVFLQYIYEVIIYIYSHFSTYFRKDGLTKHKNFIFVPVPVLWLVRSASNSDQSGPNRRTNVKTESMNLMNADWLIEISWSLFSADKSSSWSLSSSVCGSLTCRSFVINWFFDIIICFNHHCFFLSLGFKSLLHLGFHFGHFSSSLVLCFMAFFKWLKIIQLSSTKNGHLL